MEKINLETKKEKEPVFSADLRVDFIRHGKPTYTEEEIESGEIEGELNTDAIKDVENQALELAKQINKEKELVVIWASPKKRAQQTSKIIANVFKNEGIQIIEKSKENGKKIRTIKSLSDVKMSPEFVNDLIKNKAINDWMNYWTKLDDLPEDTETTEEVKKRTERLTAYLERASRTINSQEEKKLHFICVGHEETVRDLLEEAYDTGTEKGTGPTYGEILRVDINKSTPEKDAIFDLKYRNLETKLGFNKKERDFYNFDEE